MMTQTNKSQAMKPRNFSKPNYARRKIGLYSTSFALPQFLIQRADLFSWASSISCSLWFLLKFDFSQELVGGLVDTAHQDCMRNLCLDHRLNRSTYMTQQLKWASKLAMSRKTPCLVKDHHLGARCKFLGMSSLQRAREKGISKN